MTYTRRKPSAPDGWQSKQLATTDVAGVLGVPEDTARLAIKNGWLPSYRVGRRLKVSGQALAVLLAEGGLRGDLTKPRAAAE